MATPETAPLAQPFESHRARLHAIAHRMLGSPAEADDAVQEAWLRLSRGEAAGIENLGAWLTTVVARICLDMLRARQSRREDALDGGTADAVANTLADPDDSHRPDSEVWLADSVGLALLVVLERLAPVERIAFVLHDLFDVPFDEIAPIVGRSPTATRQLASRARRRVRGTPEASDADRTQQRQLVDAFLAASRDGDLEALLTALDPDVVLRADRAAVDTAAAYATRGAPKLAPEARGAHTVADAFRGRARGARAALVDGLPGAVWLQDGVTRAVFRFTLTRGLAPRRISAIDVAMDPARIGEMSVVVRDA